MSFRFWGLMELGSLAQSGTVIFVARILRIDGCIGIELGLGEGENDYSVTAVRRGGGCQQFI